MKFYYGTIDKGKKKVTFLGKVLICNNPDLFEFLRELNNEKGVLKTPEIKVHEWKERGKMSKKKCYTFETDILTRIPFKVSVEAMTEEHARALATIEMERREFSYRESSGFKTEGVSVNELIEVKECER